MKKLYKMMWVILVALLLTSCMETRAIEKTGIINASGIDLTNDDSLTATLVAFQFIPQSHRKHTNYYR